MSEKNLEPKRDRVFIDDVRALGLCRKGLRRFAEMHGLDWSSFLKDGIEVSQLETIDDVYVKELLRRIR